MTVWRPLAQRVRTDSPMLRMARPALAVFARERLDSKCAKKNPAQQPNQQPAINVSMNTGAYSFGLGHVVGELFGGTPRDLLPL
jgi:hypothetical protein